MATQGPTQLPAYFNTDADFEAWVTGIHNAISAMGLVQTADTGQINPATVVRPSGVGGYEIWRFNDSFQTTVPVFIKIEYGTNNNLTTPSLWFTVGSGSNGAGVLTGQVSNRFQTYGGNKSAGITLPLFICGDGSDLFLALNIDVNSTQFGMLVYVTRPRDANGAPTNEGVLCGSTNPQTGQHNLQWCPVSGSMPGVITSQAPAISPWFFGHGTGGENADFCPFLMPINGNWRYARIGLTGAADFGPAGAFTCTMFGTTHTFLALNTTLMNNSYSSNGNGGNPGLAIAWE